MSTTSLLRQSLMAQEKKEKQDSTTSMLRRSLEVNAGVAPGTFSPTNTAAPETPQRIYKPGAKAYAPINLRSLAESTVAPASSQEQTAPKYVSPFAKNEDYAELSRYKSTKNAEDIDNRNFLDKAIDWIIGAKDNEESKKYNSVTGYTTKDYDDELYEYINKNPDVVSRVNTNEATSGQYFSGVDQSFLQEMEDAEIADYNYLYATQGKDKANEFLQNLKKDLTKRQMDKYVAENQQYARENPVAASAWSVLSKPLEGVSLAGQLMDYKLDRDVDPNAGYNRFVKQNQTIRQTVPENWSKAGQFLYGTGMSILDNVYNMALVGAFGDIGGLGSVAEQVTLGLMSSSAASESVLESLEDGYSADRAIIQGALAGAIEYLTEKISWGALMEPNAWKDGTIKYILKNVRQEGLEEGISTVANWGVDLIGDIVTDENRSDLREVFTDYKDGNYKSMWGKLRDMGIDLALDVAGGALSGGVLAGGGSLVNLAANTIVGNNANADYSQSQIGKYVQESFNDTVGNKDASDHQQSLAKKAMNQFDQNGKVSNRTLGELMKSNAYMESERTTSNNLLGEAMEQINSGKTVSDSTVKEILDNKRAVDFLSRNSGLQLQDNMTRPERFQAVRNSLNQTIQQIDEVQAPARKIASEIRQENELYKQKTDMVSEFAKTLGEQGGRTLMHMAANEDLSNITSLAGAYTKVYNEVKANPEVNLNEVSDEIDNRFTPSQLYSVYQAAVADRETDFKENGVPYEGETINGRSEDNGGNGIGQTDVDSGVGVESISRWTAEAEKGNQTSERARIIAKNQAAVSGQPKVTAKEAGFANGSNRDEHRTTQVVPEENWASLDEDTYSFFKELKSQGYNVIGYVGDTFFEDPLSTNDRGEHPIVTMRGFQQGKTIGVRVDAELSARQIIMHELFHGMVASDSALQGRMLDKLNDKYKGRMDRVFQDYVSHYEWMLPEDATPEQIEEWTNRVYNEILADAYAGIEPLRYTMNYRTASQFTEDVREMVSGNGLGSDANGTRAGPAFSREELNEIDRKVENGEGLLPAEEVAFSLDHDEEFMERERKRNQDFVSNDVLEGSFKQREWVRTILRSPGIRELLPEDKMGKTSFGNGSYGRSMEHSTICPRSLSMEAILDALSEKFGRPITVEESIKISQLAWAYMDAPECAYCFVAMDRKARREYLLNYMTSRNEFLKDIDSGMSVEDAKEKFLNGRKPTEPMEKRMNSWIELHKNGSEMIQMKDLASDRAIKAAAAKSKSMADQVTDALKYAQSASWAKKYVQYTAYNGEILKWTQKLVNELNRMYGMRMYSFSDFHPAFTLEDMQMITDAALRGLKVLAYTKEIDFARIMEPTGANINISVFAQNTKDENGDYGMDAMQGADWEEAKALRAKSIENGTGIGITMVCTNDEQVEWALAQDWVDVVIPFHMVKTGAKVAEYFGWDNYTDMQADKKLKNLWDGKNDQKMIEPPEHQNNKQLYLEALERNHLSPRFEKWVDNPNYMKLVNETRRAEGETPTVQPKFNLDAADEMFDRMKKQGGYYQHLGLDTDVFEDLQDTIYDDYVEKYGEPMHFSRETDPETLEFLNNQDYVTVYRSMQIIDDKLYPPMAAKVDGKLVEPTELNVWYRADERPDLVKNGKFKLNKANGSTPIEAAYNPYFHASSSPLNDQFSSAYKRENLVTVEGIIPRSELTSGYKAEGAKDAVGILPWHSGTVTAQLNKAKNQGPREIMLSRWFMAKRIVPNSEVADVIAGMFEGTDVQMPYKLVTPGLREELEKRGVPIQFSRDTDYMEAVNSGDMDTAQRMVDEAAKDAGYVLSVYHGTGEYFNTFMRGDEGIHLGNEEQAKQVAKLRYEHRSQTTMYHLRDVWENISSMDTDARWDLVTKAWTWQDYYQTGESIPPFDGDINNDKEVLDYVNRIAEEYNEGNDREVGDVPFSMRTFDRKTGENIMHLYAKISNPFVINGDITEWFPSEIASVLLDRSNGIETRKRWDDREYSIGGSPFTLNDSQTERLKALTTYKVKGDDAWDSLAGIFSELGFDGIQYLNQYEGDKNSDSFIALHPSDVKSADPVTYDDQGNIIPLSQRFNKQNDDIRYSRDSEQDNRVKANFGTMFSGTGTVDFALRNVINHSFAVEYDNNISAVYRMNNGDEIYEGDVRDAVKQGYIDDKEVDFLHASPVCKDYSAQKQDATETPLDISTAKAVADVIDSKRPKIVTIENVRGYKNSRAVKLIQDALDRNGYVWDEDTYKASDFGGATIRERYFIRAARDVSELPAIPEKKQAKSWYEATKDLIPDLREMPLKKGGYMESRWNEIKDSIDRTHPVLLLRGTKGGNLVYAEYDKPSPTIIASETEARIVMPDGRFLEASPRVLARIQGLPDEFKLPKQKTLANKVVGNGVPVELTQAVLGSLLPVISGEDYSDIRFSRDTAPEFYSKLEREIEGYKGEKLGAASVTSYLKGKGVKDEEIKWTGIATFLEGKKSVSKAELLQYVRDNQIQIEEQDLTIEFDSNSEADYEEARDTAQNEAIRILGEKGIKAKKSDIFVDYDYGEGFVAYYGDNDEKVYTYNPEKLRTHWGQFKTPGGENYREILYKIPGSAYSNHAMKQHWDETGVLAHARVQDFETSDGRILFVDEIQSDWHNAGEKSGYSNGEDTKDKSYYAKAIQDNEEAFVLDNRYLDFEDRLKDAGYKDAGIDMMVSFLFTQENRGAVLKVLGELPQDVSDYLDEYTKKNDDLQKEWEKAPAYKLAVPDAPFRSGTYIQYVLKDLLRKAAEGGYDYLAWTTGQMQEDRWSSEYAEGYRIEYDQDIPKFLSKYGKQWGAKPTQVSIENLNAPEIRELGDILVSYEPDLASDIAESLRGFNADSTAEYYDFSDEDYERVSELTHDLQEALYDGRLTQDEVEYILRTESSDVPAIPITEAMKESVLYEGQPRFSRDTTGMESELQKQNKELNQELKEVTERYHHFKDQLVLTKVRQATEKSANRVAKQLVKDYSSNVSADEIAKALREASKLVLNVKDDTDIDELQTQLKDALRPYAMQMVTNASELMNAEDVETQKSIRNDLRSGTGIIVTEQMKKDVPDWASFRKAQFGNMKLVSGPKTNIHDVYLELSQKYGEGYFPADVANESDMLQVIADVMADLSAIYDNPYTYGGANIAEAIESCTNDMMMSVVGSLESEQPTFADKEKAKRDALRKQAIEAKNAALQRVREQRDDALAKQSARYKDRIKSIYNKRQQYELRTKIRRKVKGLSDKLLKPTDEKHIPYELQGAIIDVLRQINTGSRFDLAADGSRVELGTGIATKKTNAFLELKERLTELSDRLVLDEDLLDSKENGTIGYLTELAKPAEISIDSMDTEQLHSVMMVLNACEAAVRTWNKTVSDAKWAEISEAGEALYTENANKNPRDEYRAGIERTINLLTVDNLTPEAYFSRMGNAGKALFKMLRAAQDDNIRILKEAQEFSEENGLYDLKLKDYEQKTVTVRFGNRDVEMSKAQLMELYILNKREASRVHIEVGGILPEAVQKKFGIKKVTYAEPIRNITQEDIAKAMTQLSPADIKIADAMQEFISTVMTKHGNDASMKVYGYKKFGDENYWPIRVNSQDLRTELGEVKTRARSVSNKGFTKPIKPNANQSVAIGSIFDTFTEHVAEMANYASHLAVEKDINRIYNFTERDAKGAIEVSTKYVMRNVYGPQGTAYFEKLMQDLANGMVSEQSYFGGLVGKFKAAAVGSNLRVILQQPTAIFRAMDMISPKYLAQGLLHPKRGMDKAIKNSPIAQWKDWGYFDINTGRSTKNILFQNSSGLDRVQNALMSGAGLADSVSWGALYSAVEAEIKDTRPDLDARSKEFDKVVADRFADIIDHSQVVDGVLQRSALMRSQNWIDKFATAFMAEPTKQYNMMLTAIYDLQHSGPENKAKAAKVLARTTAAMLFAGVLNAAVQSIVDAIRDDDPEEKYWEKFLMKFTGEEDSVVEFMKSNLGDFLNPAQYVPYAKDIVSLFQGFDVERTDLSLFKDLIDDGKKVLNSFDGKGKYSQTNNIINFMNTASKFLGLSIGNVKRDVAGIANTIAQETGSYVFEYRMAKFTYNLNQATNKGRFVEVLAKAYEAGDTEAFNIIMNDLIKEDKFATTTMTTEEWIKKRLKDKHDIILK